MTVEELPPDPRGGYELRPRRLGGDGGSGRGRRLGPAVAGLTVLVGLALAIAKPWAPPTPEPGPATPDVAEASAPASGEPADSSSLEPRLRPTTGPSVVPTRPPSQAAVPIARGLLAYAGTWGLGTGGWWMGERAPWTTWTSSVNLYEGGEATVRQAPACERLVELPVGRFVALGAPSRLAADSPISATRYLPDGTAEAIPDLVSISRPADEGIAYLFLNDGGIWQPGPHRFVVRTPAGPVTLDACFREWRTSPHNPEAAVPPGILDTGGLEPLASALAAYQGAWGVGTGGWRPSGVAWSRWERVAARRTSSGEAVTLSAPDCGDMDAIASGVVVAVTAPIAIADPKDVTVLAFGSGGGSRVMTEIRRLPRGADAGIVPIFREDGEPWRSGPYRFVVATPAGPVALDACFLSLGPVGSSPGSSGILAP